MDNSIYIKYIGGNANNGEMDAHTLSEAIYGYTLIINTISTELYGNNAIKGISIKAIRHASFGFDIIYSLQEKCQNLFGLEINGKSIIDTFKELISLLKHLKGDKPRSSTKTNDGKVSIENNSGVTNIYNNCTVILANNQETRSAMEKAFRNPLQNSATKLQLESNNSLISSIEQARSCAP